MESYYIEWRDDRSRWCIYNAQGELILEWALLSNAILWCKAKELQAIADDRLFHWEVRESESLMRRAAEHFIRVLKG